MHRIGPRVVSGAAGLMVLMASTQPFAWTITTTVDTYHVGKFSSNAFHPSKQPHISYYDNSKGDVKYATYVNGTWTTEIAAAHAGKANGQSIAVYTAIAADKSSDVPHIAYYDDNQHALRYAVRKAGVWTVETVDSGGGSTLGIFPSIALDGAGNPHISYHGSTAGINNGSLKHAAKSNGTWTLTIVDQTGDAGYDTSIAVDASGEPRIAYVSYPSLLNHSSSKLRYVARSSGSWTLDTVEASGLLNYAAIALDTAGSPHISYHESAITIGTKGSSYTPRRPAAHGRRRQ